MKEGVFVVGCGGCGATIYQRNMRYYAYHDPVCHYCQAILDGVSEDDLFDAPTVANEVNWCGCGDIDALNRMMLAYLRTLTHKGCWPRPDPVGVSADAATLLSCIACNLEWTDHGGSVGSSWLTDDGKEALANLEMIVAASESEDDDE